jgi:hypothetical protein
MSETIVPGFELDSPVEEIKKEIATEPAITEDVAIVEKAEVDTGDEVDFWFDNNDTEESLILETPEKVVKEEKTDKEWWEIASEKTGVSAKSEEDYLKSISTPKVVKSDEVIDEIDKYLRLDDTDLVLAEYKDEYGDLADKKLKKMDNEDIEIEAMRIRSSLNAAKSQRVKLKYDNEVLKSENMRVAQEKLATNVREALLKTKKVFDMNVGRDESDVQKWSKVMEQYILSGKAISDVQELFKEAQEGKAEKLIEFAQLMKSRDKIFVGIKNKGNSEASKAILDELKNTSHVKSKGESPDVVKKQDLPGW